jgi:hypothetical protein
MALWAYVYTAARATSSSWAVLLARSEQRCGSNDQLREQPLFDPLAIHQPVLPVRVTEHKLIVIDPASPDTMGRQLQQCSVELGSRVSKWIVLVVVVDCT